MHPSDPRHKILEAHIRKLAEFIGLSLWVIRIHPKDAGEAFCSVDIEDHQEAEIHIGHKFWDLPDSEKNETLLHELAHCPLEAIHSDYKNASETILIEVPKARRETVRSHMKIHLKSASRKEEAYVNGLAVVLARFAPPFPDM